MTTLQIILLSISIALALIFIIVRTIVGGHIAFLLKTLASFSLVASAFIGAKNLVTSLIGIGLLLGMIGDMVLDLKVLYDNDKIYLNSGMLSFGLGHIAYFSAFTLFSTINELLPILISTGAAILLTIGITLSSKTMKLDFGKFLWQTVSYTFVLSFMTVYALILAIMGGLNYIPFIGMFLFFLSDIVLSFQYFGGKISSKPLIAINHTLYYSAQIILLSVLFMM